MPVVSAETASVAEKSSGVRVPGWLQDITLALLVAVPTFGALVRPPSHLSPYAIAISVVPVAMMFVRRRWPWPALAACVAWFLVSAFTLVLTPFSALPTGLVLFTIAVRSSRRTVVITALSLVAVMLPVAVLEEWSTMHPLTVLVLVMIGFFAAAGDAVRSRRAYIAQITQRAVDAEQTREAEASRRVAEDRLRIARDLHDAVAHQISVISLNAGVASSTLDGDPDTAREALVSVRTAARRVLGEIGTLVSTLRAPGEAASLEPAPGVAQIAALIQEFRASGLHITVRGEESIRVGIPTVPAAVGLTAYRVTQEALTNAQKHGTQARAHIWMSHDDDVLRLVITNPMASDAALPSDAATDGHGILGMQERVDAVNGTLRAGRDGGTFRVEAVLPLRSDGEEMP